MGKKKKKADKAKAESTVEPSRSDGSTTLLPAWWRRAIGLALRTPAPLFWASIWLFTYDVIIAIAPNIRPKFALWVLGGGFLLRLVLRAALRPGMLRAVDSVTRGGQPSMTVILQGRTKLVPMMVTEIVGGFISGASFIGGGLPGFAILTWAGKTRLTLSIAAAILAFVMGVVAYLYASLGVAFAEQVVVFESKGAFPALNRAWELARGNRWRIFKVTFFAGAIEIFGHLVGVITMIFGVFVTIPLARLAGDYARIALYNELRGAILEQTRVIEAVSGDGGAAGRGLQRAALTHEMSV